MIPDSTPNMIQDQEKRVSQVFRDLDVDGDGVLCAKELQPYVDRHNELLRENSEIKRNQEILRRNQKILFAATLFFGVCSIVATVYAARELQSTKVGADGILYENGGSGLPVVTHSHYESALAETHMLNETTEIVCMDYAELEKSFASFTKGTKVILNLTGGTEAFPRDVIDIITGSTAYRNDTHFVMGNLIADVAPDNPCNQHRRRLEGLKPAPVGKTISALIAGTEIKPIGTFSF